MKPQITPLSAALAEGSPPVRATDTKPRRKAPKRHEPRGPPLERVAYTIPEFAEAHRISVAQYFALKKKRMTPPEMKLGGKLVISVEAAAAWRAAMTTLAAEESAEEDKS